MGVSEPLHRELEVAVRRGPTIEECPRRQHGLLEMDLTTPYSQHAPKTLRNSSKWASSNDSAAQRQPAKTLTTGITAFAIESDMEVETIRATFRNRMASERRKLRASPKIDRARGLILGIARQDS
jgi:hypothetical protein